MTNDSTPGPDPAAHAGEPDPGSGDPSDAPPSVADAPVETPSCDPGSESTEAASSDDDGESEPEDGDSNSIDTATSGDEPEPGGDSESTDSASSDRESEPGDDEPAPVDGDSGVSGETSAPTTRSIAATSWDAERLDRIQNRTWLTLALSVIAVVILLVNWPAPPEQPSSAPDHVARYFDAIRAGDVRTALDMMDVDPTGEKARFLRADAISPDWTVKSIVETSHYERYDYEGDEESTVTVTLADADGVTASGTIELTRDSPESEWTMDMGLPSISLTPSFFDYFDLNGVTAPIDPASRSEDEITASTYYVLPGLYRLYAGNRDLFTTTEDTILVLPGEGEWEYGVPTVVPEITEKGEKAVQDAVNAYIDQCASLGEPALSGCPFGDAYLDDPREDGYYLDLVYDATWRIDEYPVVTASPNYGELMVVTRKRGTATLSATGEEKERRPGQPIDVTDECFIEPDILAVSFAVDGTVNVAESRYSQISARDPETCEE